MSDRPIRRQDPCRVALTDPKDMGEGMNLVCNLTLRIDAGEGQALPRMFRVDTGAAQAMVPLKAAAELELPLHGPETESVILLKQSGGGSDRIRVRHGRLRVWWGLFRTGDPFDWPVTFLVDAPADGPWLLGLGGVIRDCTWLFDGRPDDESLFGRATFTDVRGTRGT